ncbi:MAG TPA: phosphoribosyltransferase family protein [Flavisolibacter sp.]|nr:phosphoribosyltransferase family protein [Flavisolibacter sp.]
METTQNRNCVLDREAINRKMKRMALEIAEQNNDVPELLIAGITGNGEIVAKCLVEELIKLSPVKTSLIKVMVNKKLLMDASLEPDVDVTNKTVILVDDVANTGKTMLYALKPFLASRPARIQTLVLVERSHKLFPIQTDYAGLSLATTLQEHISVETEGDTITGAWLY